MRQIGDFLVCKERNMPDYFMDDVWFRGVLWIGRMADVLGRTEDPVGECVEELALTENTMRGTNVEPSLGKEIIVEFSQLRNPLFELELALELDDLILVALAHALLVKLA